MNIELIRRLCEAKALQWTNHVMIRLLQRGISTNDVEYAIIHGEIIEQYPDDYPYPSCLVLGATIAGKHLHVVCGATNERLWLITAYYPNPDEWSPDFKRRKGHE